MQLFIQSCGYMFFIVMDDIQQPNPNIGQKVHTSNLDYVN
jgi:hypothetical protein